jgi:hypothetical protein
MSLRMFAWTTYLWGLYHSMHTPKIITYPRSGTHYLQNLILAYSSQEITFSHYPVTEDNFVITIARDPFDSIQSLVAMKKHYNPETYSENDYKEYYVGLYKYLYSNANLVIDYNDLINFPEETTKTICDLLGFKKNPSTYKMSANKRSIEYLVSSKTVKEYGEQYFKIEDMVDCYDEYHKLLSKADRVSV